AGPRGPPPEQTHHQRRHHRREEAERQHVEEDRHEDERERGGASHPFSPLMMTPRTIHFWARRKTARIGSTLTTAAAVTRLYSMKYMLVKLTSPSVTTFIVGEFTTTR